MADTDQPDPSPSHAGEAYQVVARRYRPQTFDELIGQGHVAKALKQAITTGRIGHAYLFTGARGVGKTSAARVLAKALNCITGPTPTPCNECEVCTSVTSGDDVDVIEIDGASNRQIDDIRQLRQNVAIRPSRVPYKVYIIDEVHMLTKEAFNALLKTLEEPPEHVKFIFATTDPQKVPITILSRCQRFDFAGIEATSIAMRLRQIAEAEGVEIDDESLAVLAQRAAGSMRDSQSLLEQLLAVAGKKITAAEIYTLLGIAPGELVKQLVQSIVDRNAAAALAHLDESLSGGAEVGQLIDQLLGFFRDVMAMVVGCDTSQLRYVLPSQYEATHELGQQLGVHTVLAMIQVLDQTSARMRASVHTRTLAEMAVVRLAHLDDLDDLASAIAELRNGEDAATRPAPAGASKKNGRPEVAAPAPSAPAAMPQTSAPTPVPRPPAASQPQPSETPSPQEPAPQPSAVPDRATEAAIRVDQPAAPTPAAPASLSTTAVQSAWKTVLANMDGLLGSQAEMASGVRLHDDGSVLVSFASTDRFSKDMCENPSNRPMLEKALATELGADVSMRFEVDASAPGSNTNTTTEAPSRPQVSRRQLQAEVAERPFVTKAMELFAVEPGKLKVTPPGGRPR